MNIFILSPAPGNNGDIFLSTDYSTVALMGADDTLYVIRKNQPTGAQHYIIRQTII